MKANRKTSQKRKSVRRRLPALSLSARVERIEKLPQIREQLAGPRAASIPRNAPRFVNLDSHGKPTTGEHVAVYDRERDITWAVAPLQNGKNMSHAGAMKACAALDLLGHKDWRAPTIQELLSIVDYERHDPAVDPAHFKGPYSWTWASTPYKGYPSGAAWIVILNGGFSDWLNHNNGSHARAVRAGQPLGLRSES